MLKQQRIIIAECDLQTGDECWEEMTLGLESGETIDDGMIFLKEMGWSFDAQFFVEDEEIKAHCPYCQSGILKPNEELHLVENEEEGL